MKKKLTELKKVLIAASNSYYSGEETFLSDEEFDLKFEQYRALLRENGISLDDPKYGFSTAPAPGKKQHTILNFLGSLNKTNSIEEVKEWLKKTGETLNHVLVSVKYDGNSVACEYDKSGQCISAVTRGKDGVGEDITHIFKFHKFDTGFKENLIIRYEVITTDENYEALCLSEQINYANNRSLVAGLLGRKELSESAFKKLTLIPLAVSYLDRPIQRNVQLSMLKSMQENSRQVGEFQHIVLSSNLGYNLNELTKEIEKIYNHYDAFRISNDCNFMMDGLVIEFMQSKLGYSGSTPDFSTALKFPYLEKPSTVTGINFYYGKTGRITPVVTFEPIEFYGAVQQNVSIANYLRFDELKLAVGDKVLIQYRNDVLSYLSHIIEKSKNPPIEFINNCPICEQQIYLSENETYALCINEKCPGRIIGNIINYLNSMEIKGVKENILEYLFAENLVRSIQDLYNEDVYEQAKSLPRFGEKSISNIKSAIYDKRECYDYQILAGMSIPLLGTRRSKELLKSITLQDLLKIRNDSDLFEKIKFSGYSVKTHASLVQGLEDNIEVINFLLDTLNVTNFKDTIKSSGASLRFVITGDLSIDRDDFIRMLEERGHRVTGSISSKTDYLITNFPNSGTVKNKQAVKLGIEIISEQEALSKFINE